MNGEGTNKSYIICRLCTKCFSIRETVILDIFNRTLCMFCSPIFNVSGWFYKESKYTQKKLNNMFFLKNNSFVIGIVQTVYLQSKAKCLSLEQYKTFILISDARKKYYYSGKLGISTPHPSFSFGRVDTEHTRQREREREIERYRRRRRVNNNNTTERMNGVGIHKRCRCHHNNETMKKNYL